jgi:hypothetical protein
VERESGPSLSKRQRPTESLAWEVHGETAEGQQRDTEPPARGRNSAGKSRNGHREAAEGRGYGVLPEVRARQEALDGVRSEGEGRSRLAVMDIRAERQQNAVADEVSALVAVVRPILLGLLWGLKADVAAEVGGYPNVKLSMLSRLRRPGDGDCGICFEYAVHDAMRRGDQMVSERVDTALQLCNVPGDSLDSILFAVEKSGSEQFIDTARDLVTSESRILSGTRGQPAKLHKHIQGIATAFRRPKSREALPWSISGLWKADLFVGKTDTDRWVGTTVKVNPALLEGARGLRVGIVPASHTETDAPYHDEQRNLVVCPILHDGNFMQVFYEGWQVVQAFLAADARMPSEAALPRPPMREVARMLVDRREFPVVDVHAGLVAFAQPELLTTEEQRADVELKGAEPEMQKIVVPEAMRIPGL